MMRRFEVPRGMRDFYPDEAESRQIIFDAWTRAAREFGFSQYDSCVVESLDLLKHKSGPEIVEQVYDFRDKSGRELALRPEMTPTLARMIAARRGSLSFPLKWFAIAQCFRYERASRGRKREHYQWNLDIVGEDSPAAEAEVISCALRALSFLGFAPGEIVVHLSSRALLAELLLKTGIRAEVHQTVFRALDKKGKMDDSLIAQLLSEAGLDRRSIDSIFKIAAVNSLDQATAIFDGMPPSAKNLADLISRLELQLAPESIAFDMTIVRGLDYYTGPVFEAFDSKKEFRAVFGGGRYDRLLADMGGGDLTAVGLGFGDVVVSELLALRNDPAEHRNKVGFAIGYLDRDQYPVAVRMARSLRDAGVAVDLSLRPEKAKGFFARVGNGRFENAVYIGPDDIARGSVRVKNLSNRTETAFDLTPFLP